jgi:Ca2+-binding RTX toxin-like protein
MVMTLCHQLFGGLGKDMLSGGEGQDRYDGGDGIDTASYAAAADAVIVSLATGGSGGEAFGDTFVSIECLKGSNFGDTLTGDGNGNVISGGKGADVLAGGAGADDFVFSSRIDSGRTAATRDVITDFERGTSLTGDDIDLSAIDANSRKSGNNAFKFIGGHAFHHVAGELHFRHAAGGILVEGDVNGDGRADFSIMVLNVSALSAQDFIL